MIASLPSTGPCNELLCPSSVSFAGTLASGTIVASHNGTARTWVLHDATVHREKAVTPPGAIFEKTILAASGQRLAAMVLTYSTGNAPVIISYRRTASGWAQVRKIDAPLDQFTYPSGCPCFGGDASLSHVVISGYNGLAMWDLGSGKRLWSVRAPFGPVWFGPNGTLYRQSSTGGIDVVSTTNGTVLYSLPFDAQTRIAWDIVQRSDGLTVVSGPFGIHAATLDLTTWKAADLPTLMAAACREANRDLTAAEWSSDVGKFEPYQATCSQPDR